MMFGLATKADIDSARLAQVGYFVMGLQDLGYGRDAILEIIKCSTIRMAINDDQIAIEYLNRFTNG